jgi:hypothetical protein
MTSSLLRALGAGCASALLFVGAPVQAGTLTLDIPTCSNPTMGITGGTLTVSCNAQQSGGAPSCTTLATPNPVAATGGNVSLAVSCSGGSPVAAGWTTSLAGATISGNTMTVPANTGTSSRAVVAFIRACSADATPVCADFSAQTTQSADSITQGPPPTTCGDSPVTDMGAVQMNGIPVFSKSFGSNTIAIASFTVPAGYARSTNTIAIFEYGTAPTSRRAWMSKTRCDMSATAPPYFYSDQGPVFSFSIGGNDPYAINMQPGETWYMMVRNQKPFSPYVTSCAGGACDIGIKWYPPN